MCRRRRRARARFPAPNRTPSAALFLLRTLDNKFFGNSIRARRACRSATSSPRRLRFAKRRRLAYRRKAGKSRGSIHNRNFAVIRKIFGVRLKKNPRERLARKRLRRVESAGCHSSDLHAGGQIRDPRTRNLPSRAAIPPAPSAPNRRRPAQAAPVQSCWINDRNPGNFGRRRKRSNSSRRGRSAEIFGESASAFWISA